MTRQSPSSKASALTRDREDKSKANSKSNNVNDDLRNPQRVALEALQQVTCTRLRIKWVSGAPSRSQGSGDGTFGVLLEGKVTHEATHHVHQEANHDRQFAN